MDERLKFRLTGGVLVVALAAILLPMAFDGAGVADLPQPGVVPPAPSAELPAMATDGEDWAFVDEREALAAGDFGGVADVDLGRPLLGSGAAADGPEAGSAPDLDPEPGLGADGLPRGWAVQLASFAEADNARALRSRLQGAGYAAFLTAGDTRDGVQLTRVAVGPSASRDEAEALRAELARAFELDGMVVRFSL